MGPQNATIFLWENEFENVVCKMVAISPPCVKTPISCIHMATSCPMSDVIGHYGPATEKLVSLVNQVSHRTRFYAGFKGGYFGRMTPVTALYVRTENQQRLSLSSAGNNDEKPGFWDIWHKVWLQLLERLVYIRQFTNNNWIVEI